jgi:hypothetical protein
MSQIGQKEAVVKQVLVELPTFQMHVDNAVSVLSTPQLENIKSAIYNGIVSGHIKYGKNINNTSEVRTYARSMVMNHLKKAKELNGGHVHVSNSNSNSSRSSTRLKTRSMPKGVNPDLLTDELKELAKTLV